MNYPSQLNTVSCIALCLALTSPAFANDNDEENKNINDEEQTRTTVLAQTDGADTALEEVITTGTRSSRPRTAADSTVPIDVLSGKTYIWSTQKYPGVFIP